MRKFFADNMIRVTNRLLGMKRRLVFGKGGRRVALVSYVLFPPYEVNWYFEGSHNNKLMCFAMVKTLVELGYEVHVHDYLDEQVDYGAGYSVFVGHNRTFSAISSKLGDKCQKILITTGSSPAFDNQQLEWRNADLQRRKNTQFVYYQKTQNSDYARKNFEVADLVFMIGNDFVKATWYPEFKHKYRSYHNIVTFPRQKKTTSGGHFVFMSGHGQLRRGLDLLLDVFSNRSEKLFVRSPYQWEPDFAKLFSKQFSQPNIKSLGFLETRSREFQELIRQSDFVILPSCSEGESGSVLNLMAAGLIPVITENVGLSDVESFGYLIKDTTVEGVAEVLNRILASSPSEIEEKRDATYRKLEEFTKAEFEDRFKESIVELTVDQKE